MIDLHMHSTASDGKLSPSELVDLAAENGLKAIALTDHDTIGGLAEAMEQAKAKNVELVPGIEINCDGKGIGFDEFEVLGLFVNPWHKALIAFDKQARRDRENQKRKMVERLQELGFDINFGELKSVAKGNIGRPHVAQLLVDKHPNRFSSIRDAFTALLARGKPAYVEREKKYKLGQAIELIKAAGGLVFLAHPGALGRKRAVKLIELFQKKGGHGIETYYPYHVLCPELRVGEKQNAETVKFFQKIARKCGLLESGGSDFHGGDRDSINAVHVPDSVLEKLKEARQ
jgi:hypothetical protein